MSFWRACFYLILGYTFKQSEIVGGFHLNQWQCFHAARRNLEYFLLLFFSSSLFLSSSSSSIDKYIFLSSEVDFPSLSAYSWRHWNFSECFFPPETQASLDDRDSLATGRPKLNLALWYFMLTCMMPLAHRRAAKAKADVIAGFKQNTSWRTTWCWLAGPRLAELKKKSKKNPGFYFYISSGAPRHDFFSFVFESVRFFLFFPVPSARTVGRVWLGARERGGLVGGRGGGEREKEAADCQWLGDTAESEMLLLFCTALQLIVPHTRTSRVVRFV